MTTDTDRGSRGVASRWGSRAAWLPLILVPIVLGLVALGCGDNRRIPRSDAGPGVDAAACVPECTGRLCGPDGCGGSCGPSCPAGSACSAIGLCEACTPSCAGRVCGDDGCGGSCGTCSAGTSCNAAGQCQSGCTPSCAGRACGDDGCGGSCGTCSAGTSCNAAGQCQSSCTPSCAGRTCGSDGCGGSCGTCSGGQSCSASGVCESGTCTNPGDCGSPTAFICDPTTLRCASPECAGPSDCLSTELCLLQAEGATEGACYRECVPASPTCGAGQQCNQLDFAGQVGYCKRTGSGAEGSTCAGSATSTGCGAGLGCIDEGSGTGVCRRTCQVFGSSSACPFGQTCHPVGLCVVGAVADSASIGGVCSSAGAWCALVSGRITGGCDSAGICRALCRVGFSDCPSPQTCIDDSGSGDVGICT